VMSAKANTVLIFWGSIENLSTVFAFADITMTMLAFVNLFALAFLFKIAMRILNDYDNQRAAGIKTPVFDSSQFPDLDLDRKAWPANPAKPDVAASAELNAQVQR